MRQAETESESTRRDDRIHVLIGLLRDSHGRWLVNRRRAGTHEAGRWEFPGGKREREEPRRSALERELAEELGIVVLEAEPFIELVYDYPGQRVLLDVWHISVWKGEPRPLEQQKLRWVHSAKLGEAGLLEANEPIVERIIERFGG